jgi:hypothetical protein
MHGIGLQEFLMWLGFIEELESSLSYDMYGS